MPRRLHDSRSSKFLQSAIRAGEIAQVLFLALLEHTWAYDIGHVRIVRNEDHQLIRVEVVDGLGVTAGPRGQSTCDRHAEGWLIEFPSKEFRFEDADAMRALLTDHNSIWALVCMHVAVQVLFEQFVHDVRKDISEFVHYPTDDARRLVNYRGRSGLACERNDRLYPDQDVKGNTKAAYDITLKDGTRIVLDLASAQWKLKDLSISSQPVMLWPKYWQRWGGTLKYRVPFRSHQARHAEKMDSYRVVTHHTINMEQSFYFNTFMTYYKKDYPHQLQYALSSDIEEFTDFKARILNQARDCILNRPHEIDEEASSSITDSSSDVNDAEQAMLEQFNCLESLPFDIGAVELGSFDWESLRKIIQMPGKYVTYREKKRAKMLLSFRCVYKMPGDWKLVFLEHTLPSLKVPEDYMSENPFWQCS